MLALASIGIIIFGTLLFLGLVSTSINRKSYKYYKPSYDDLTSGKLKLNMISESHNDDGRTYYYFTYRDPKATLNDKLEFLMKHSDSAETMVIVSENDRVHAVRLVGTDEILDRFIIRDLCQDPYTLYYRIKFQRWFRKNRERLNNTEEAIIHKSEN